MGNYADSTRSPGATQAASTATFGGAKRVEKCPAWPFKA
jgi:hypothetical protein